MRTAICLVACLVLLGCDEQVLPESQAPIVTPSTSAPTPSPAPPAVRPKQELREAAEKQQLTARRLAARAPAAVERALSRLPPSAARSMRANVEAARLLSGMTAAQPAFPKWRIVAPPPAAELRGYYRDAERQIGVPWEYLAAIHLVETRMGRIRGTSTAGAQGPMQFLPSTWAAYGAGGDINDPRDAVLGAARLLRANGAPGDMADALWNYNHSDAYVRAVTIYATEMERDPVAYRSYWHWRVLYKHRSGSHVLPEGYPDNPPVPVG